MNYSVRSWIAYNMHSVRLLGNLMRNFQWMLCCHLIHSGRVCAFKNARQWSLERLEVELLTAFKKMQRSCPDAETWMRYSSSANLCWKRKDSSAEECRKCSLWMAAKPLVAYFGILNCLNTVFTYFVSPNISTSGSVALGWRLGYTCLRL